MVSIFSYIFLYIFGASILSIPGDASHRGSGVVDATDSEVSRVGMKFLWIFGAFVSHAEKR